MRSATLTPGPGRSASAPGAAAASSDSTSRTRVPSAVIGTVTRAWARLTGSTTVMFETRELASSSLGISTRLLSGVRRRVYVRPTSSTIPSTSAIATLSPSRTGWLIAIMTPATKFASVERAANPTTSPSTADDASTVWAAALRLVEREQGGDDADEDDDRLDRRGA